MTLPDSVILVFSSLPQETTATRDNRIEIRVTDHGRGISPDAVETLFRPMARGPRTTNSGTDLGLYLAREHAYGLGGQLTYSAAQPQGSRFHLSLPT